MVRAALHSLFWCSVHAHCRLGGWEALLRQALARHQLESVPIFNHGHNGAFTKDVFQGSASYKNKPYADVIKEDQPTIVVIFIGTNDVGDFGQGTFNDDYDVGHLSCCPRCCAVPPLVCHFVCRG